MNVSFLNPALLWGLLAAAIPILIHLFYRRRPKPISFPAVDFILRARRETQRRIRLKRFMLFAARTLLLAAVATAIARPRAMRTTGVGLATAQGPSATAIVLDTSASMSFRFGGTTLLDHARSEALELLDALGSDEPASVVICGGPAQPTAAPPSFDRAAARRALREATQTFGHSDLTDCVTAAARALSDSATAAIPRKRIAVATDMTGSGWRLDAPPPMVQTPAGAIRPEVTLLDAAKGAPLPNASVGAVVAEREPAVGPRGFRITATIANYSKEALHDLPVALQVGTGQDARAPIHALAEVPAGGSAKKTLTYNFAQGGPIPVAVTLSPDALDLDDICWLALTVPREVKALLVDGSPSPVKYRDEAFFVEAALASAASPVRPTVVDVESLVRTRLADYDVVFLLNVGSVGAKGAELSSFVEKGGGLFIALGDEVDPDRYDSELADLLPRALHVVKTAVDRRAGKPGEAAARFSDIDWEHPALSVFGGTAREGFESVRTFRYMLLKPERPRRGGAQPPAPRVLASYDDGAPALVEGKRGQGKVILYTSTVDREWTDWSIRTSFLPTMQRIAAYLAGGLDERRESSSVVFTPRTVTVPQGAHLAALVKPDGRELGPPALERRGPGKTGRAQGGLEQFNFVPDRPGLWQVKIDDGKGARLDPRLAFAVLPDPRESNTARIDSAELTAYFGGAVHAKVAEDAQAAALGPTIPLWSVLLLLALFAFLAEGLLLG